jgi:hypothetical protein
MSAMTIPRFRSAEPLFILIMRNHATAESLFRAWIRDQAVEHAQVQGNRMHLHESGAWEKFVITWPHGWADLTIWDAWNRRHIWLD